MTRRNAPTAGLIAAAVVILLWSGWRIVDARLTVGTGIAAWGLWLVLAVAVASAVAYLRELVQHRGSSRRGGWRPVPGVALLWVAGIATVAVFGFLMPGGAGAHASSQVPVADGSTPAPAPASPSSSSPLPTTSPTTAGPIISPKATRGSAPAAPSQPRAVPVVAAHTASVTPRPVSTAPASSAPAPSPTPTATSTSTSAPLITLPTLPNGKPKPTK